MSAPSRSPAFAWPVLAAAAWVFPGLGHYLLGEKRRAGFLAASLAGLFVMGLAIGGLGVVDAREQKLWFAGQVLIGPMALGTAGLHSHWSGPGPYLPPLTEDEKPAFEPSIGRPNEMGTLYCTLAGAMNLLAVLDVVWRAGREETAA